MEEGKKTPQNQAVESCHQTVSRQQNLPSDITKLKISYMRDCRINQKKKQKISRPGEASSKFHLHPEQTKTLS